jgi:3-hydroxybutyrate dehydrogenase
MAQELTGRVAVITGAASGMGLAFAETMAAGGASVVLADLDEVKGRTAADKINAAGQAALFCRADIAKRDDAAALVDTAVRHFARLDILINNAGLQYLAPIHEFPEDKWDQLIGVMLTGPFLTTKYALPHMMAQKRGRIINISSFHGLVASEYKSAYVAAKHGLIGFTKVLALEGAPHNIGAVAVCPSYVRTPLVEKQIAEQARRHGIAESEVIAKIMLAPAAVKRLLEPSEVAALIVFLCSDAASAITGTTISIDCGWTAR